MQIQNAVFAYFSSWQILPFGFRRRPNIKTTLGQCYVSDGESLAQQTRGVSPMLVWRWPIVYDAGPTLAQHWTSASCLLGGGDTRWSASRNEEVLLCGMCLRHLIHNDVRPRLAGWDAAPAPVPGHPGEGQDWGTGPRSRDVPQANTPPRPQRIKMLMHSLCNDYCMQNNPVITSGWSVIKQMRGGGREGAS